MIRRIWDYLVQWERDLRASFGRDITDPVERKKSLRHYYWMDHGVLRYYWHNFENIAPGVYRSNHPNHQRFEAYAKLGIKSVLNLRGKARRSHYLFEQESCEQLGLTLIDVQMNARAAPKKKALLMLLDAFETIERPFMMHCKSGADRTGLAGAIYLMVHESAPLDEARRQLSFRYLHIRKTSTGILDHFLDVYGDRQADGPIAIDEWIKTEYEPEALTLSYEAKKRAERFWQGWRT